MLESGELEGEKDESGRWRIPQRIIHELLPSRPARKGAANGSFKACQEALEISESAVETQLRMCRFSRGSLGAWKAASSLRRLPRAA